MNIRHVKKTLLVFNIVITGLLLFQAVIVYQEWKAGKRSGRGAGESVNQTSQTSPNTSKQTTRMATYQTIVNRDIFGTTPAQRPVQPPAPEQEEIVPTQLQLRLNGTMVGDQYAYAVITDVRTKKEGIYTLNDTIQNATIAEILPDRIVLMVNSRKEALILFPENKKNSVKLTGGRRQIAPAKRQPVARKLSDPRRSAFKIPSSR